LKLKRDEPLSNFALNFNLRRYNEALAAAVKLTVARSARLLATLCSALPPDAGRITLAWGSFTTTSRVPDRR
jgi:hypothetical protein